MSKSETLVLKIHKAPITGNVVKIRPEAREILRSIQAETGLSATHIVSEMIRFSADKIEVM